MPYFFIESKLNGLVFDITGCEEGRKIITCRRNGGGNQLWQWKGGILVSKTGYILDVQGGDTSEGANAIAWSKHGGAYQQWRMEGDTIVSNLTGLALDIKEANKVEGSEVILYRLTGSSNQGFRIVHGGH